MPLNTAFEGRVYEVPETFEVGREHIRAFAEAIGEPNPLYLDKAAAVAAGYRDVIAPPTFLTTLGFRFRAYGPISDPDFGLNYSLVVHGEQRFSHQRAVVAGDKLTAKVRVEDIRVVGRNEYFSVVFDVTDAADGSAVSTSTQVVVSRGSAPEKEA